MQAKVNVSYSSLSRAAAGSRLPTWPVAHGFVLACDADPDEWHARWRAARGTDPLLPDASAIETVAQLRTAVRDILRRHDLGVVSAAMREQLPVVRRLSRYPEQVEAGLFERFLTACGADEDERREWLAARRRVVGAGPARSPDEPPTGGTDPAGAPDYPALLSAMRELREASGVRTGDLERNTGGRLTAERASEILSGARPPTGEELVLLLRALGVREGLDRWIDSWFRVRWACLGAGAPARRSGTWFGPVRRALDALFDAALSGLNVVLNVVLKGALDMVLNVVVVVRAGLAVVLAVPWR